MRTDDVGRRDEVWCKMHVRKGKTAWDVRSCLRRLGPCGRSSKRGKAPSRIPDFLHAVHHYLFKAFTLCELQLTCNFRVKTSSDIGHVVRPSWPQSDRLFSAPTVAICLSRTLDEKPISNAICAERKTRVRIVAYEYVVINHLICFIKTLQPKSS